MTNRIEVFFTEDEKQMLREVMKPSTVAEDSSDLANCQISSELGKYLLNTENIAIVIKTGQDEIRYPLVSYTDSDNGKTLDLGVPEILDKSGTVCRSWRSGSPQGIVAFNENNDATLGDIANISSSGIYIRCNIEQFKEMRSYLEVGDLLNFNLRIVGCGIFTVCARLIRFEDRKIFNKGIALSYHFESQPIYQSDFDETLAEILKAYLLNEHPFPSQRLTLN
jgi:hypothetical protein